MVKNLCANADAVRSLGWEDPLEKKPATHSSILAWGNPMDRGAWWATVHRVARRQAHPTHTFCLIHSVTPPSCFKRLDHGGRLNLSDSFLWEFGVRVPKHIEHTPALGEGQANCGIKMIIADLTIAKT